MKKRLARYAASNDCDAFTLAEMLVAIAVLAVLILFTTQLVNHATGLTRTSSKHIDTDGQARAVFDRMAVDFAQMLRRTDIDYFIKRRGDVSYPGNSAGHSQGKKASSGQELNDQIAFYSGVPGYYPLGVPSPIHSSPIE